MVWNRRPVQTAATLVWCIAVHLLDANIGLWQTDSSATVHWLSAWLFISLPHSLCLSVCLYVCLCVCLSTCVCVNNLSLSDESTQTVSHRSAPVTFTHKQLTHTAQLLPLPLLPSQLTLPLTDRAILRSLWNTTTSPLWQLRSTSAKTRGLD